MYRVIYTLCESVCLCIHIKTHIPTSRPIFFCCPSRRFLDFYSFDHNLTPTTSVTYFDKWNFIRILYDIFKITVLQNVNLKSCLFAEHIYQCHFESHKLTDINKNKYEW